MLVGYARVSTADQNPALQLDALNAAGCERVFVEKASGAQRDRPELAAALSYMREGDSLVVWKLDRLARSMKQLIETVEGLEAKGVGFRSLTEAIDTTKAGGKLVFHVFGALAEFERSIIRERTRAGLDAAKARGRRGGRPKKLTPEDLKAAKALLADPSITVGEVARRLKVSSATLYRQFPSARAASENARNDWRPKILEQWDEIELDPLTTPPDNFEGMSTEDAVELIKEWFFENFEDPAHRTPYEGAEGGYQYIWGGPYDARDVIENVFADTASSELIEAAIEALESEGLEWAPNSARRQAPDEEEPPEPPLGDASTLHAEMLRRIASLEESMVQLPGVSSGIGHNHPPEPIEAFPLTVADQREITAAIEILKAQPVEPQDEGKAATEAAEALKTKGQKIGEWLAKQGDAFVSEAVKEAGKEFGKWAPRAFWALVFDKLFSVHEIVGQWLSQLHLPF